MPRPDGRAGSPAGGRGVPGCFSLLKPSLQGGLGGLAYRYFLKRTNLRARARESFKKLNSTYIVKVSSLKKEIMNIDELGKDLYIDNF